MTSTFDVLIFFCNSRMIRSSLIYIIFIILASCSGSNSVKVTCDMSRLDGGGKWAEEYTIDPMNKSAKMRLPKPNHKAISLPIEINETKYLITTNSTNKKRMVLIIDRQDPTDVISRYEEFANEAWMPARNPGGFLLKVGNCR